MEKESDRIDSEARKKYRKAKILAESSKYEDRVKGEALAVEAAALVEKAKNLRQAELHGEVERQQSQANRQAAMEQEHLRRKQERSSEKTNGMKGYGLKGGCLGALIGWPTLGFLGATLVQSDNGFLLGIVAGAIVGAAIGAAIGYITH